MADPVQVFEEDVCNEDWSEEEGNIMYEAFQAGWNNGDYMKRKDPPHYIFKNNQFSDEEINKMYDVGRKLKYDLSW